MQKVGQLKKTFKPFSNEIYEIVKIDRFTKVCILKEIVDDDLTQPKMLKMHCRFLSKVYKDKVVNDDYEPFAEIGNSAISTNEAEYNHHAGTRKKPLDQNKEVKPKKSDEPKVNAESSHKMTLRKRN